MSRVDELMKETKDELVATALEFDLDASGNKPDLAERIAAFETGAKPAEPDEPADDAPELAPADDADAEVVEHEHSDDGSVERPDDIVLVRFTGKNTLRSTGRFTFTQTNPFQAVPSDAAKRLINSEPRAFRAATDDEVREYYS